MTSLKAIFRLLCAFSIYLLLVELLSDAISLSHLVDSLLRFIPYCVFLVFVAIFAWPVVRPNRTTLLMALFLFCVFLVFLLGVTRRVPSLSEVPFLGLRSHYSGDLQGFLVLVAVSCFLTGGYFMLEEVVMGKLRLQQQVQKLQEVEAVLADSEERFRTLVEHAPDGIFVQTQGRFAYLNSTALALFGATAVDQLLNHSVLEVTLPEDHAAGRERIRLLEDERKAVPRSEQKFVKLDGTVFDAASSAVPLVLKNQNSGLVFFRDITERKRLEDQLRQAQKMEAVGQLAGGVAHDFNNMMTVIEGYCGLLLLGNPQRSEDLESLQQIQQAARRASNLTRQLLTFSRRQVVQVKLLDLNLALQNLVAMLSRLLGEDIALKVEDRTGLPLIEADLGMIEQVVMNLSTNARDAMPHGGQLTIRTDLVDIADEMIRSNPEARKGQFVCMAVADTGCGMDEATRNHIFEPFFTTKELGKGTGLGLATVYGIIKQHNGWIEVSSAEGQGTVFRVFLPAVAAASEVRTTDSPNVGLCRGHETVLLVEDEDNLRDMLRLCLQRQGYKVLQASNGTEALAVWQQEKSQVDLLFTDMLMPGGLNGRDLAERLRAEKHTLKVIISSGYSQEMVHHGLPTDRSITFLPKPYQLGTLAEIVRKSLDSA